MDKYLILVNKNHEFKDVNFNLVKASSLYQDNIYVEEKAYENFLLLQKEALQNGFNIEIESAYRSKEEQQKVFCETEALKGLEHTLKFVARPGYSEHQTGLAIDFCLWENKQFYVDFAMSDHPVLDFVKENAYKYGFIIRYPKGKENITGYGYEPWHLRYVGSYAKEIMNNDLTLEEYLEKRK